MKPTDLSRTSVRELNFRPLTDDELGEREPLARGCFGCMAPDSKLVAFLSLPGWTVPVQMEVFCCSQACIEKMADDPGAHSDLLAMIKLTQKWMTDNHPEHRIPEDLGGPA